MTRNKSKSESASKLDRRTWMKLLPALAAVGAISPPLQAQAPPGSPPSPQQNPQQEPPQRVTKEMLHQALKLIGLEFTDAQETMMLPGVNRNLASYETLRKIHVPLDTEPGFRFIPLLPGKKLPSRAAKFSPSKPEVPARRKSWQSLEDLAFYPVTQLAVLIRSKRVSPLDLAKMYLERLKKYAPKLNCVITLTEALALAQDERATREIQSGRYRGPLHGVPWGAKDLFATKGIKTTWGAEPYQNQILDYDAAVVERLDQAGAVLLAKLSIGALAQGGLWFGGMTKTPWNTEQSSSGSSAGSASATAAGLVGFAIGTETLGSIVSPSTRCGVVGLRPTYGRVSRYGALGLSWTMDKIGPICRSVEDCALVLNAIYGPDGRDNTVLNVPLDWDPSLPLNRLRIGILQTEFDRGREEQKGIYKNALEALKKAGAKFEPMQLPEFSTNALRIILNAEAATAFDDLTRDGGVNQLRGQEPGDWPNSFRTSRMIPAVEYIRAQRARTLLMQEMDKLMSRWDVFVSPTGSASLLATNLTGHPQVLAPCGFIKDAPQGLLFTGRLYEEGTLLRVALAYEQTTKWHTMHPKEFGGVGMTQLGFATLNL